MKKIILSILFLVTLEASFGQCTSGATGNTIGENYTLIWADEFSTDGAVCADNWFHQTQLPAGGNWYNNEQQHYTDELANSAVANGMLKITAIKEQYTDQGFTKSYTSARLNSKYAFTYGRVDARAKLPAGAGTWPAIWMLGQDIIEPGGYWSATHGTKLWPATGEIDIMEHWGNNPNVIHGSLHTTSSSGATQNTGTTTIPNVSTEFHIYSMIWDSQKIQFLVDDVAFYTYQPTEKNAATWPFDKPQYLLLNIAMGGIGGAIDPNFTSSSMEIDYIRVYQKETSDPPPPAATAPTTSAPTPTESSSDVISMFSDAYQNVTVDTWRTSWSIGSLQEVTIDGGLVKKYTSVNYVAAEVVNNQLDITGMTHFHVDVWSPNSTQIGVKLVDFGSNGVYQGSPNDDTEHEVIKNNPTQGEWMSYDIPIADFTNLQNKRNIAQLIFYSNPSGSSTIFIDNVYFFDGSNGLDLEVNENQTSTADIICNKLIIADGATLTIASGHTLTVNGDMSGLGNLVINSGASLLTYDGNTVANVTINRSTRYGDGRYSFVGTPTEINEDITGADLGSVVYAYNESVAYGVDGLARWESAINDQLVPGIGYAQAFKKDLSFTGKPNDGTITVSGLSHSGSLEPGWSLISNPYPAAIDVTAFLEENSITTGAIYLWDDHGSDTGRGDNADYLTANSIGSVNGPNGGSFSGYIGSVQGFFVQIAAPQDNPSVVFTEDMRVSGSNTDASFFRKEEEIYPKIKLALASQSGQYNEILLAFRTDATFGVDRNFDAAKLRLPDQLQFYSLSGQSHFAIQGLPNEKGATAELGYDIPNSDEVALQVLSIEGLPAGMTFHLLDKEREIVYDLSEISSIGFEAINGIDQNRFRLIYEASDFLMSEIVRSEPIFRFFSNYLNVTFGQSTEVEGYIVYDLSGKTIAQKSLDGAALKELNIPLHSSGMNIIKVITREGIYTRKITY